MTALNELLDQAIAHHSAGRLSEAEAIYRQVLQQDNACAAAWHLLGVIAHQVGANDTAIDYIRQAIRLQPNDSAFYSNLGEVYRELERRDDAIVCYHQAIQLNPQQAEAYNNLGNALNELGRVDEARQFLERALQLKRDYPAAWSNLGNSLKSLNQIPQAEQCYRQAVALDPNFAQAHCNLGSLLDILAHYEEAEQSFNAAIRVNPQMIEAWYNLGGVLKRAGRYMDAARAFSQAVQLKPDHAEAHNNLAVTLKELGHHYDALRHCLQALELRQGYIEAHNNTAVITEELGLLDDALEHYQAALRLNAPFTEVRSGWLLALNYHPRIDRETLIAEHRKWGEIHGCGQPEVDFPQLRQPHSRLRIGYVSPDFRRHPVTNFMEPILNHFDDTEFEVTLYADVEAPDKVTERLMKARPRWRPIVRKNDEELLQQIREDEIDILFDLAGHTSRNRLGVFCRRAAPVQVSYLGFPNTSGVPTMDYLLTDAIADPPGDERWFTEKLIRIEGGFSCYQPRDDAPPVNSAPISNNGFVSFGSLHNLAKLNSEVLDLWAELLRRMPTARLILFRTPFFGEVGERFRQEFARRGVETERLDIRWQVPAAGYQTVYYDIDISLDVFPWCGHTTACESIWMGVPMITLSGNRHASRMVASVLHSLGRSEWVAHDKDEYLEIAMRMASDPAALAKLRSRLRDEMAASTLCDAPGFARKMETAWRQMWAEKFGPAS